MSWRIFAKLKLFWCVASWDKNIKSLRMFLRMQKCINVNDHVKIHYSQCRFSILLERNQTLLRFIVTRFFLKRFIYKKITRRACCFMRCQYFFFNVTWTPESRIFSFIISHAHSSIINSDTQETRKYLSMHLAAWSENFTNDNTLSPRSRIRMSFLEIDIRLRGTRNCNITATKVT